jgi:hypothetical protein
MRTVFFALVAVAACSPNVGDKHDAAVGDAGPLDAFEGPFSDFPQDPFIDPTGGAPPVETPGLFGDPSTGAQTGGPCLVEPEVGTLYPQNWLRPRFTWIPAAGENIFELRLSAGNQVNQLVVYTSQTTWTMPASIWLGLTEHTIDAPITVSIRGATLSGTTFTGGPALGSKGTIAIAPAKATGAIVYWTTTGGTKLRGFTIGEETVHDIVSPTGAGGSTQCVGCHSSTPDGAYVGFSASTASNDGNPSELKLVSSDGNNTTPPFISTSAQTLMARSQQQAPTFSKQHWVDGDHIAVTMLPLNAKTEMVWTDLETGSTAEGTGWGVLARTGDTNSAASATFARTTDTLLYTSNTTVGSGVTGTDGDLRTIPFSNRAGGASTKVTGASETAFNEYYGTFSPDDKLIAFNRVAAGASSYNNPSAEVYVIPAGGGTAVRIAANDPPSCSGKASPGVTNSWPKWSPGTMASGTKQYYWLTFSSTRSPGANPQLYVTPVITQGTVISTFPSLYLWNQPPAENNHTPAWDDFAIVQ